MARKTKSAVVAEAAPQPAERKSKRQLAEEKVKRPRATIRKRQDPDPGFEGGVFLLRDSNLLCEGELVKVGELVNLDAMQAWPIRQFLQRMEFDDELGEWAPKREPARVKKLTKAAVVYDFRKMAG